MLQDDAHSASISRSVHIYLQAAAGTQCNKLIGRTEFCTQKSMSIIIQSQLTHSCVPHYLLC